MNNNHSYHCRRNHQRKDGDLCIMILFINISISPIGPITAGSMFVLSVDVSWLATTWQNLSDELLSWQHLVNNYETWKQVMYR